MEFLDPSGILCVTIDDYEFDRLKRLLDDSLSSDNWLGLAVIRNNPSGRSTVKGFAINHEYALFYAKSSREVELGRLPHTERQISRYNEQTESGSRFEWENFRKNGTDSDRADRTKQFFPIYYNETTNTMRLPHMNWNDASDRWDITEPIGKGEIEIWPINEDGVEKVWKYGIKRTAKDLNELKIELNNDRFEVYRKKELRPEGSLPRTWWDNPKYSARDNGTRILNDLFGPSKEFDFPKSPYAVMDCLRVANLKPQSLVLDFFAGSGTTAHAVINLNKEDGGKRKYVLIEMADYFDTTLKPRIQKVVFSDSWKNGKPVLVNSSKQKSLLTNAQPHMFQYIRLESYDDTFYNIRFREVDGPQLKLLSGMPDYFLSYMLDHETEGSPTLLNLKQFDRPFDYKLLVNNRDGVLVPRSVDLVTTFNFLIGLTVQTIRSFEHEGNPYIRVTGTDSKGIRTCILWRNVPAAERFDAERQWLEQEVLTDATYDKLYVNGENTVPDALLTEDEFKRRMFEGVR
jgi:adenine-specific DNA-methyltransferase